MKTAEAHNSPLSGQVTITAGTSPYTIASGYAYDLARQAETARKKKIMAVLKEDLILSEYEAEAIANRILKALD